MRLDTWQAVGVICGAILALCAVVVKAWKGLRRMWKLGRKASQWLDEVKGSPGQPSLMERLESIEELLAEHLEWHGEPGARPSGTPIRRPNGHGPSPAPAGTPRHRR